MSSSKKVIKAIAKDIYKLRDDLVELSTDLHNNKFKNDIINEITITLYDDISEIIETCIDIYYSEYKPRFYKRRKSLYKVYKLTCNSKRFEWKFGHEFMPDFSSEKHRVSNEYIYEWMFEKGYHGGAHTIDQNKIEQWGQHPRNGTPWYRTAPPIFEIPPYTRWSNGGKNGQKSGLNGAAKKSFKPPARRIELELNDYQKGKSKLINKGLKDSCQPAVDLVGGRYNIFNY